MANCRLQVSRGLGAPNKTSKLNKKLLKAFPSMTNHLGGSAVYDMLFSADFINGRNFSFGRWFMEDDGKDEDWQNFYEKHSDKMLLDENGEPKLYEIDNEFYFQDYLGRRYTLNIKELSVKDRLELINSLSYLRLYDDSGKDTKEFVESALKERLNSLKQMYSELDERSLLSENSLEQLELDEQMSEINYFIKSIENEVLGNKSILENVYKSIEANMSGFSNMKYIENVEDKEDEIATHDDIQLHIKDSNEVRDTNNIDLEIAKIIFSIQDFDYDFDGNQVEKYSKLTNLPLAKNSNEVKNKLVELFSNIIEIELAETEEIKDPYTLMTDKLRERAEENSDPVLIDFLKKVDAKLASKKGLDVEAFKTKFVNSFYKSQNIFTITEISKDKNKLIIRHIDPASQQDKISLVADELFKNVFNKFSTKESKEKYNQAIELAMKLDSKAGKASLHKLNELLGLNLKEKTIDNLFRQRANLLKNISKTKTLTLSELFIGKDGVKNQGFFDFKTSHGKELSSLIDTYFKSDLKTQNEIYKELVNKEENTPFSIIAEYEAVNRPEIADSSMYVGAKQRWMYSLVSGMNKEILAWKSGNKSSLLLKSDKNLQYVDYLLAKDLKDKASEADVKTESDRRIAKLQVITNSELKNKIDNSPVQHKEIGEADLHMDSFFKMFNHMDEIYEKIGKATRLSANNLELESKNIMSYLFSADKSGSYSIKGLKIIAGRLKLSKQNVITGLGQDNRAILEGYLIGEYNQMKKHAALISGYFEQKTDAKRQEYLMDNLIPDYHFKFDLKRFNPEDKKQTLPVDLINEGTWNKFGFFNTIIADSRNLSMLFAMNPEGFPAPDSNMESYLNNQALDYLEAELIELLNEDLKYLQEIGKQEGGSGVFESETNIINSNDPNVQAQYLLNSMLNNLELFQLFNGDLGFYKQKNANMLSMEDALKRGPAILTDGIYSFQNSEEVTKEYKTYSGKTKKFNTNKHTTVAILNEIKQKNSRYQNLITKGTNGNLLNYDFEIADAEAYITVDFYKRIISKTYGWTNYDDKIFNRLNDKNYKYTDEDIKWLKNAGRAMAALKLTGFSKQTISDNGSQIGEMPVYLKYSTAILTPAMIAGSEMQYLADAMEKQGVDQVVFKSGSKASNMSPTTIHLEEKGLFAGLNKDMKLNPFLFNLSGLKLQVELPTKFDKDGVLGNQHLKNLIANLDVNSDSKDYVILNNDGTIKESFTGKELFDEYEYTIKGILQDQLNLFAEEIGLEQTELNTIKFSQTKLRKLIISQLDMTTEQDLIDILKDSDIPLEVVPGIAQRAFPIIQGYIHKNVGKVRTNSASAIQIANIGFDRISNEDANNVLFISDKKELTPPIPLTNEAGEILYFNEAGKSSTKKDEEYSKMRISKAKIMLPFSSIYSKLGISYEEFKDLWTNGFIDKEIFNSIIGYRIPNQSISSNDTYEVVGILPPNVGDIGVVYNEITGKTGSDFDIDKMYLMMPNYELNKMSGRVDYIKDNSLKGKQNRLIELMTAILTSEKTYDDLISPLDDSVVKIKDTILDVIYQKEKLKNKELTKEDFLNSRKKSPLRQLSAVSMIKSRVDMLQAKKLVATMANHMTDIPMSQLQKQMIKYNIGIDETSFEKIFASGHDNDNNWKLTKIVSYLMNAAVDAAKDNYIIDGNFNSYTANGAMLLFRLGVDPKNVFKLLLNDKVLELTKIKQLTTQKFTDIKVPEEFSQEVLNDYSKTLVNYLTKNKINFNDFLNQKEGFSDSMILGYWNIIQLMGKDFNNDIVSSKSDSNGGGKNIAEHYVLFNRLERLKEETIVSDVDGNLVSGTKLFKNGIANANLSFSMNISENEDMTFLGAMLNNSLLLTKELTKNMLIENTDGYQELVNSVLAQLGDQLSTSADNVKMVNNYVYPLILSRSGHKIYNIDEVDVKYLLNDFPKEFSRYKSVYSDNLFLQQMYINNATGLISFPNYRHYDSNSKMLIKESLKNLIRNDEAFGNNLIRYAFLTTGFKPTYYSFNEYIPAEFFLKRSHHVSINRLINSLNSVGVINEGYVSDAMKFIAINNPENYKVVKSLKDLDGIKSDEEVIADYALGKTLGKNKENFRPFLKSKKGNNLMMLVDIRSTVNKKGKDIIAPVYKLVKTNVIKTENDLKYKIFDFNSIKNKELFSETGTGNTVYLQNIKPYVSEVSVIFENNNLIEAKEIISLPETKEEHNMFQRTKIQMQPNNVEKILNGTKTTTIRESILKGGNISIGETKIVNFGGKDFYVTNRGHLTIKEAGGLENMLKSEGLNSIDDFMYNQSKNWANGKGKMYVFDISELNDQKNDPFECN